MSVTNADTVGLSSARRISWLEVFSYALPPVGAGYMFCLVTLYTMKFSTDVLLIAPALMGTIYGISRFWDAISDPLVGYLSDKTKTPMGRRRPWLLGAVLPAMLFFWMLSAPPEGMTAGSLALWMGVAIIGFFSAQTMFIVPHMSLGAELTDDYHERTKIFAARHAGWIAGYISALGTMYFLILAESESEAAVRALNGDQSLYAGLFAAICLLVCVWVLRERPEFADKAPEKPWAAARDIWKNKHARLLLIVIFIENLGGAAITILTLYTAQYVMNAPQMAPFFILSYMVFSFGLTPLWTPLAKRFGKKPLWLASMLTTAFAFGCMITLEPGMEMRLLSLAALAGAAGSCGGTINPSIKSDIIDLDEYHTGERKEGAYFAAWYFVSKSAYGVMLTVTGFALSFAGFEPNIEQSATVVWTFKGLYAGVPFIAYIVGAVLFSTFNFDENEHKKVIAELEAQRSKAQ
jgi:GPH family glycoside/pentoside/hexuronide:cation symporter